MDVLNIRNQILGAALGDQ